MRTIGVNITGADLNWIGLDGTQIGGTVFFLTKNKIPFPASRGSQFENLLELKGIVSASLQGNTDNVAIIKAGNGCSPLRAKCELIIELTCNELHIPCNLIAPQTVDAAHKRKVALATGSTLAQAFNGGQLINPQYLEKAAYCAWTGLPPQ